jgi:HPt (histidine-containing phosphotransfer) domain-containing protein
MEVNSLSYDLNYLKEISNNDEDFLIDMIKTFIDITPATIKEMKKFLQNRSFEELGKAAHRFAPSVSFIGVQRIIEAIDQIEDKALNKSGLEDLPELLNKVENDCSFIISSLKKDFKLL